MHSPQRMHFAKKDFSGSAPGGRISRGFTSFVNGEVLRVIVASAPAPRERKIPRRVRSSAPPYSAGSSPRLKRDGILRADILAVQALDALRGGSLFRLLRDCGHGTLAVTFHAAVAGIANLSLEHTPAGKYAQERAQRADCPAPEPFGKEIKEEDHAEDEERYDIQIEERLHELRVGEGDQLQLHGQGPQRVKPGIEQQKRERVEESV